MILDTLADWFTTDPEDRVCAVCGAQYHTAQVTSGGYLVPMAVASCPESGDSICLV